MQLWGMKKDRNRPMYEWRGYFSRQLLAHKKDAFFVMIHQFLTINAFTWYWWRNRLIVVTNDKEYCLFHERSDDGRMRAVGVSWNLPRKSISHVEMYQRLRRSNDHQKTQITIHGHAMHHTTLFIQVLGAPNKWALHDAHLVWSNPCRHGGGFCGHCSMKLEWQKNIMSEEQMT